MARNEKVSSNADTINDLVLKRASIGSAPFPAVAKGGVLVEMELDKIEPNPDQPRQWMDPEKIEELATSIASRGTRQPDNPVLLRPVPGGDRFVLVSGERRWRAKQLLRDQAPASEKLLWNTIRAVLVAIPPGAPLRTGRPRSPAGRCGAPACPAKVGWHRSRRLSRPALLRGIHSRR